MWPSESFSSCPAVQQGVPVSQCYPRYRFRSSQSAKAWSKRATTLFLSMSMSAGHWLSHSMTQVLVAQENLSLHTLSHPRKICCWRGTKVKTFSEAAAATSLICDLQLRLPRILHNVAFYFLAIAGWINLSLGCSLFIHQSPSNLWPGYLQTCIYTYMHMHVQSLCILLPESCKFRFRLVVLQCIRWPNLGCALCS